MLLRKIGGWALIGATAYVSSDAVSEAIMYMKAKDMILEKVATHDRFLSSIHADDVKTIQLGPWYNSSISFSHGGTLVSIIMPCKGIDRSSDITVRVRNLHYTLLLCILYPEVIRKPSAFIVVLTFCMQAVRKGTGLRSTLLYNLSGGEWEAIIMDALIAMGPGGAPISLSLLEKKVPVLEGMHHKNSSRNNAHHNSRYEALGES